MTWIQSLASRLDDAVVGSVRLRGASDRRIDAMAAQERISRLQALQPVWGDPAMLAFPGRFLERGPVIEPTVRPVTGGWDVSWPSGCAGFDPEIRRGWPGDPANEVAWATLLPASRDPSPAVVVIHGYGGGHPRVERWVWPVRAWRRAGLDVVLATLPLHGRRATRRTFAPGFPAADPRRTHEGFRQAVWDLTALIDWLRRRGAPRVGAVGMSLGGYTAALLATLPGLDLAFAGMVVPLASLSDYALRHGRLGTGEGAARVAAALELVYRPSSPLARPPAVAAERVMVLGAEGDRVTGAEDAVRLARHFGVEAHIGPGSHLVQRGLAWGELGAFLARHAAAG